jgi:predicted nucleotidyltransferase
VRRLTLAFIVAPLAPFIVYIIFGPYILLALMIGAPVSYVAAGIGALIYHYKIKNHPHLQTGRYCVIIAGALGMAIGILPGFFILTLALTSGMPFLTALVLTMTYGLVGLFHGITTGAVFWLIARPKKNSNTAKKIEKMPKLTDITAYDFFAKLSALPFVEAVYLYGSRARGDAGVRSDIDLAILCPKATDREWHAVLDIIESADTLLEIDCVRLDTLAEGRLKDNIEEDKKVLYERAIAR